MTGTFLACASATMLCAAFAVEGVEHENLDALGEHGFGLLLLLRGIPVGVGVEDGAVGAQLLDLRLEERLVCARVACGHGVGKQEADLGGRGAGE